MQVSKFAYMHADTLFLVLLLVSACVNRTNLSPHTTFFIFETAGKSTLYNRLMDKKANRAYKLSSDKGRNHKGKKKKYSGVRRYTFIYALGFCNASSELTTNFFTHE
jgi:hypothetical protein